MRIIKLCGLMFKMRGVRSVLHHSRLWTLELFQGKLNAPKDYPLNQQELSPPSLNMKAPTRDQVFKTQARLPRTAPVSSRPEVQESGIPIQCTLSTTLPSCFLLQMTSSFLKDGVHISPKILNPRKGMVVFDPSTQEAELGGFRSWKPAWSTELVLRMPDRNPVLKTTTTKM